MAAQRRKKILFFAEAATLAHVARPTVLANALDPQLYDVFFASSSEFESVYKNSSFHKIQIKTIESREFLRALAHGKPLYRDRTLKEYVEADIKLIKEINPDVVVGDFRLSLSVSARMMKVPYLTITNIYWSPYSKLAFPVPDLPILKLLGTKKAQKVFDLVRPFAFAQHAKPLNRVRKHYHLLPLAPDMRFAYTDADYTLYSDILGFVPTEALPTNHFYLGPIVWSPKVEWPEWRKEIQKDLPLVYLNLGSSGNAELLPKIVEALSELPLSVMVSTAGRIELKKKYERVYVANYLPGSEACALADLVICNGGSPATQQAIEQGVPILGIPNNLDQYLNMQACTEQGVGFFLRGGDLKIKDLKLAVLKLIQESQFRKAAQNFQIEFQQYRPSERFQTLICEIANPERTQVHA
jgi:UDP:flavonoid glycosyltransferase YjiC (YdhE family)